MNGTFQVGGKMRAKTALTLLCMGLFSQFCVGAEAQTADPEIRFAQAVPPDDIPPLRKRPPARLRVTPYYITARMASIRATIPAPTRSASATRPMCRSTGRAAR
ncbi:exported protein of unknown function [Bradyrhizobium vignae]|uniref:Uncharacterized protein n=1 Tax=Bradyrhizobium vignae TaxID=1549949 RepID=A0A2U3PQV1_9BRAD|nr:exported protein of unknown function [Bradyrhizobium vignae]